MRIPPAFVLGVSTLLSALGIASFVHGHQQLVATAPHAALAPPEAKNAAPQREVASAESPWIGVVVPRASVALSSRIEGRVASIDVRLGDVVRADTVIARLDARRLQAELGTARAKLGGARAERARLDADHDGAVRQLSHLKALADLATGEETIRATYQEKVSLLAVGVAKAKVEEEQKNVEGIEQHVSDTELRAPFDAVVAERLVDPGTVVTVGAPLLRLHSQDLWLRFAVPPSEIASLHAGQKLTATDETPGRTLVAEIERIAPQIDSASRMIVVEAKLLTTDRVAEGAVAHVRPLP